MLDRFSRNWWVYALRGLVAIIFGVVAFARPEQATQALVLVFGAFVFVDGIFAIYTSIASKRYFDHWWVLLLEGLAGVIIGVVTFFWPNITALALLYMIAAWALITGIFEIVAGIQFRREIEGEWMLILGGVLSIVCSVLLVVFPASGAVSVIWVIGIYAIIFGITEIIFAFRLNSLRREFKPATESDK